MVQPCTLFLLRAWNQVHHADLDMSITFKKVSLFFKAVTTYVRLFSVSYSYFVMIDIIIRFSPQPTTEQLVSDSRGFPRSHLGIFRLSRGYIWEYGSCVWIFLLSLISYNTSHDTDSSESFIAPIVWNYFQMVLLMRCYSSALQHIWQLFIWSYPPRVEVVIFISFRCVVCVWRSESSHTLLLGADVPAPQQQFFSTVGCSLLVPGVCFSPPFPAFLFLRSPKSHLLPSFRLCHVLASVCI